jgi:hypothetical protein
MRANMRALCRCNVVVALFLILGMILSVVGCATSYPQSYLSTYQSPYGPRVTMPGLRIEHDLLNNKYQRVDKDDLENDWSG